MVPSDLGASFRANPQLLVGTRWTQDYRATDDGAVREYTYTRVVEVLHVGESQLLCGTLFQEEFEKVWVPTQGMLSDFSSFNYIGTAEQLSFVRRNSWVFRLPTDNFGGDTGNSLRRITQIDNSEVMLITLPQEGGRWESYGVNYSMILRNYRVASQEETLLAQAQEQRALPVRVENGPQPQVPVDYVLRENGEMRVGQENPDANPFVALAPPVEETPRTYGRLTSWDILDFESDI